MTTGPLLLPADGPQNSDRQQARGVPWPVTRRFGRDAEIARVLERVQDPMTRLVTLTGPGGVGKTRLAVEVATTLAVEAERDVAFVPLANLQDAATVGPAIAAVLQIEPSGAGQVVTDIAAAIGDRDMVLVLDNFEHLLSAAPLVPELLSATPALTVIVTSRLPLRVSGEWLLPVPPLPDPSQAAELALLLESPAVRLFADRAGAANAAFKLTSENARTIAAICQRLDGLPLAIELAAARSRFHSPAAILNRLDDRLKVLSDGPRDAPSRQQSMREAIAWSHDLLTEPERALFARLAVFVGGFTAEAVQEVAGCPEVFEDLAALVDHSLVLPSANALGEPRFGMLETIREFAIDQLVESGNEAELRDAHSAYFVDFGEAAEPELMKADPTACFLRVQADLPNIRIAMAWLRERGRVSDALRLVTAISWFWTDPPYIPEGRSWLGELQDVAGSDIDPAILAKARSSAGMLANLQGDYGSARNEFERALELWGKAIDAYQVGATRRALGEIALQHGELDEAEVAFREALLSAIAADNRWQIAAITQNLAYVAELRGNQETALTLYQEALTLWRATGHLSRIMVCLDAIAWVHLALGDLATSWESFEASLAVMDDSQDLNDVLAAVTWAYAGFAEFARHDGNDGLAVRLYAAALRHREERNLPFDVPKQRMIDARIAELRANVGDAAFTVAWMDGCGWTLDDALVAVRTVPRPIEPTVNEYRLSPREMAVMQLLVEGEGDADIADALFISRKTASNHVAAIIEKLGVANRTAAATFAVRRGLV